MVPSYLRPTRLLTPPHRKLTHVCDPIAPRFGLCARVAHAPQVLGGVKGDRGRPERCCVVERGAVAAGLGGVAPFALTCAVTLLTDAPRCGRMPKGMKTFDTGANTFWFVCPCSFRWEGNTQRAKNLAWRLHGKKCEIARNMKLINNQGVVVQLWQGKQDIVEIDIKNSPQCAQPYNC